MGVIVGVCVVIIILGILVGGYYLLAYFLGIL